MAAPYEGPLRLCDVEGAAQLLSAEWPKQSAESRAKLLRASLDEALPQHVVVVESGAVVARDRVLRSTSNDEAGDRESNVSDERVTKRTQPKKYKLHLKPSLRIPATVRASRASKTESHPCRPTRR